jgi:hypothetical protein
MTAFRIGTPSPRVRARPNRDGTRLVCGRRDCGTTLVKLTTLGRGAFVYAEAVRREYGRDVLPPVAPEPIHGYDWDRVGDDEVVRPTGHARRQFERDRRLASGGGIDAAGPSAHLVQEARTRLSSGRNLSHARPRDYSLRRTYEYGHWDDPGWWPVAMECVACGAVNDMPDELLAEAARNQRRRHRIAEEEVAEEMRRIRGRPLTEGGHPCMTREEIKRFLALAPDQSARLLLAGEMPVPVPAPASNDIDPPRTVG